MSKINAFSRVLNRKGKTRFFYGFSIGDSLNMTVQINHLSHQRDGQMLPVATGWK
jgi:hypothetical protein